MKELKISGLTAEAEGNQILKGIDLDVKAGDVLALLGPNGHGKSTLFNVLMGNPRYKVTGGKATLDGEDLLSLTTDERAKKGLFMAFQNPPDVPGVVTMDFFKAGINARRNKPISLFEFYKSTENAYREVGLDSSMASRNLNEGYSGGEKKRNEILQMVLLSPSLCFLDEIDSGLDVDALKQVSEVIQEMRKKGTTFVIISHYEKLYELVEPNRTAVIVNGKVALEGDKTLASRISRDGYSFLQKEYGVKIEKEEKKQVSIGECAAKIVLPPQRNKD